MEELAGTRRQSFRGARLKLDRNLQLLRTYSASQIARRLYKVARNKLGIRYIPQNGDVVPRPANLEPFKKLFACHERRHCVSRVDIENGAIELLNQKFDLGQPIDWLARSVTPRPSHLWRFQLHYHEFLIDLVSADPSQKNWDAVWNTIEHWVSENRVGDSSSHDSAWHPYCISRRIPTWLQLVACDSQNNPEILRSIFDQVDYLSRNLETDLRGNHLLENLKALVLAACFFEGEKANQWKAEAFSLLKTELAFQTLESGEHYERSPMYQCVVLANLLQMELVSRDKHPDLSELCKTYARRMMAFLTSVLHPDGEIPLFSDSCFGEAPSLAALARLAQQVDLKAEQTNSDGAAMVGDYWIFQSNDDRVILDTGQLAADGLPGHAHCDLLNFEASVGGERFIVDSGNYSYGVDAMRRYCRSSVAHNVVTVDGFDHADCWSNFRMGFKGKTSAVRTGETNGFHWISASHNAYRRLGVPSVGRVWGCHADRIWFCIDYVPPSSSDHLLEGFLNFAPSVLVDPDFENQTLEAQAAGQSMRIEFLGAEQIQSGQGWYCYEFGKRKQTPVVLYTGQTKQCSAIGWYLCPSQISHNDLDVSFDMATNQISIDYLGVRTAIPIGRR